MASFSRSTAPLVATMTGSTTRGTLWEEKKSATASTMGAEESMPVFTAFGGISSNMASSWALTISTGVFTTMVTPFVFWAVKAQIQLMP